MPKRNPTIVHKTRYGEFVDLRSFDSLTGPDGLFTYLRKEGCHFRSSLFNNLGRDSVQLITAEYEYEVESALMASARRITRSDDGFVEEQG